MEEMSKIISDMNEEAVVEKKQILGRQYWITGGGSEAAEVSSV
tara:strand:- start:454 stop:582 length:129 start_codon:yes stop_codon:yes gene_type:complete